MKYLFLFLVSPYLLWASCYNTPINRTCEYYQCLEDDYQCGADGYPLGYGHKYCKRFNSLNTTNAYQGLSLSEKGVHWRNQTLRCLQKELVIYSSDITPGENYACESIKNIGFKSHANCYTQIDSSLCDLPVGDITSIIQVVDIKEYRDINSWAQMKEVFGICVDQWTKAYEETENRLMQYSFVNYDESANFKNQIQQRKLLELSEKIKLGYEVINKSEYTNDREI